eukprot:7485579-Heterocapsa_arctica.AAC.1
MVGDSIDRPVPDEAPALCCRLGIEGLFKGPVDDCASTTICGSESGTSFASPASSVNGDSDSEVPPWAKLEEEANWETKYLASQRRLAPSDVASAMPRSKATRKHLRAHHP